MRINRLVIDDAGIRTRSVRTLICIWLRWRSACTSCWPSSAPPYPFSSPRASSTPAAPAKVSSTATMSSSSTTSYAERHRHRRRRRRRCRCRCRPLHHCSIRCGTCSRRRSDRTTITVNKFIYCIESKLTKNWPKINQKSTKNRLKLFITLITNWPKYWPKSCPKIDQKLIKNQLKFGITLIANWLKID